MTQSCSMSAPQKLEAPSSRVPHYCPQETLYTPYRQWLFSLSVVGEPAKMCTQQDPNESLGKERGKGGGKVEGESKNTRAIHKCASPSVSFFPPPQKSAPTSFPQCASSPGPPGASPAAPGAAASPLRSDVWLYEGPLHISASSALFHRLLLSWSIEGNKTL